MEEMKNDEENMEDESEADANDQGSSVTSPLDIKSSYDIGDLGPFTSNETTSLPSPDDDEVEDSEDCGRMVIDEEQKVEDGVVEEGTEGSGSCDGTKDLASRLPKTSEATASSHNIYQDSESFDASETCREADDPVHPLRFQRTCESISEEESSGVDTSGNWSDRFGNLGSETDREADKAENPESPEIPSCPENPESPEMGYRSPSPNQPGEHATFLDFRRLPDSGAWGESPGPENDLGIKAESDGRYEDTVEKDGGDKVEDRNYGIPAASEEDEPILSSGRHENEKREMGTCPESGEPLHEADIGNRVESSEDAPERTTENREGEMQRETDADPRPSETQNTRSTKHNSSETPKSANEEEGEEKEEGELEEGELEEGEEEEDKEKEDAKSQMEKQEKSDNQEKKRNNDSSTTEKMKESPQEKVEVKDRQGREARKRKHTKEYEEEKKKKKKRRHHYSSEEEEEEEQPKKFSGRDDKSFDFDTLLKQEMYLVGSSNQDGSYTSEDSHPFPGVMSHFKGSNEGESYDSASGEDWDECARRRNKRKRRGSRSPSRKNEAICMFYLQGSCKRGGECPYSHEIAPTRKMELCKFYMMDCCAKKEKCLYMHKDFPCKYYHFGMKCKAGESCKFSHDPLQEITRNILLKHIELAPKDILGDFPRVSKHNAQLIIKVTEAKRKGEAVDKDSLEPLLDLEGKGFKYLDRALKNVRKKKDDKKGDKEPEKERHREREEKDKSPRKSRNREDHRESDKDKDRERDREKGRERLKESSSTSSSSTRPRDRDRDRNRESVRRSEKMRQRPSGDRHNRHRGDREPHRNAYQSQHAVSEESDREPYGRPFDTRNSNISRTLDPEGGSNQSLEQDTKWYSSDEEGDSLINQNTQGSYGFSQNYNPVQSRGHRPGDGFQGGVQDHFPLQPKLPDIDVNTLKNVLNAVQNQSSLTNLGDRGQEDRSNNPWDPRHNKFTSRENRHPPNPYMDISNDIKEVFYDSSDSKDAKMKSDFASNLDSLLQNARGRSYSNDRDSSANYTTYSGRTDYKYQMEPNINPSSFHKGRDANPVMNLPPHDYKERSDDRGFLGEGRHYREANCWENTRGGAPFDSGGEPNGYLFGGKSNLDASGYQEGVRSSKSDTDLRVLAPVSRPMEADCQSLEEERSSIYDIDFRQLENMKLSNMDDSIDALPFKVPVHSSAKEIDASYKAHSPVYYQLIKVDIPKPDFSRLKIKTEEPKALEDPRIRKMLRRNSAESPRSPRVKYEGGDLPVGSPPFETKETRDPRILSKTPRGETKGMARADLRADPRVASRADPRTPNSRVDPRIDKRDPRVDLREPVKESVMDMDMRDQDPRIGLPVFGNGMQEGSNYSQYPNVGPLPNPVLQQGIDPRGRPGILGAAPRHYPKVLNMGPVSQEGVGTNTFILPQGGIGGPPSSSFMPGREKYSRAVFLLTSLKTNGEEQTEST